MTQENDEAKEQEAKEQFQQLAEYMPGRKVNAPEPKRIRTMDEAEDDVGEATDLQASLKRLFPKFPIKAINTACSYVMVGRILPETLLDRIHLTVDAIIEEWNEDAIEYGGDGICPVQNVVNMVTIAFEIGVDSKGRLDIVELHNATQSEELEKLANKISD